MKLVALILLVVVAYVVWKRIAPRTATSATAGTSMAKATAPTQPQMQGVQYISASDEYTNQYASWLGNNGYVTTPEWIAPTG